MLQKQHLFIKSSFSSNSVFVLHQFLRETCGSSAADVPPCIYHSVWCVSNSVTCMMYDVFYNSVCDVMCFLQSHRYDQQEVLYQRLLDMDQTTLVRISEVSWSERRHGSVGRWLSQASSLIRNNNNNNLVLFCSFQGCYTIHKHTHTK